MKRKKVRLSERGEESFMSRQKKKVQAWEKLKDDNKIVFKRSVAFTKHLHYKSESIGTI